MKKTIIGIVNCVLVLSIICSLISLPAGAQHVTELNATEVDATAILEPQGVSQPRSIIDFECGELQSGSFGNMLETHRYTVTLQANRGVAFVSTGMVTALQVYDYNGTLVGAINTVSSTSMSRYGVLVMPRTGEYTINVTGAMGTYTMNCLTGHNTSSNTNTAFNRQHMTIFASMYANNPNPNYPVFAKDATNFVSQAIHSASMPMITASSHAASNDSHWYLTSSTNYSPSWAGADEFMRHWTKVRLSSYNGRAYSVKIYSRDYVLNNWNSFCSNITVGDLILYTYCNPNKNFMTESNHTVVITHKTQSSTTTTVNFCTHSSHMNSGSLQTYINDYITNTDWIILVRISSN